MPFSTRCLLPLALLLMASALSGTEQPTTPPPPNQLDDPQALQARVLEAETRRLAAMVGGDVETLQNLLDDCLEYAHSNDTVDTKDSLLESLASGRVDYRKIEPAEMKVELRGPDVAVVTTRARFEVALPDQTLDLDLRYEATWNLISGDWKMVGYRSTKVGD